MIGPRCPTDPKDPSVPPFLDPIHSQNPLVDLRVRDPRACDEIRQKAATAVPIRLSRRSLCDFELLATGAFSPLVTFMGEADYRSVLQTMRLANGVLYPIPVTLPVPRGIGARRGDCLALEDRTGELLALLTVDECFAWDWQDEAAQVYGTSSTAHPTVAEIATWPDRCVSGRLDVLALPRHYTFPELRRTPAEVRDALGRLRHTRVIAFQTRNPMHRVHEELTKRAAAALDAAVLIHPVVGPTKPGDIDPCTRVLCYRELVARYYDPQHTVLSLLPLAMRMAGPREAVWHALIRRNYGATHMIVGRDHAGPGRDRTGRPFYGPYEAQALAHACEHETGVVILPFEELVYVSEERRYLERSRLQGRSGIAISGTEVRNRFLANGEPLPRWFTRPEIARLLAEASARARRGVCVWLTGLSGAGKSTIAARLAARLEELGREPVVLDGDAVRAASPTPLGFSRADRDENVLRIGRMAAEQVAAGGTVVCAVIAPYDDTRRRVREIVGPDRFVLVHVDAPLEACERRDPKGLYALARRGEIAGFTGLDDPFEAPADPDLRIDTTQIDGDAAADAIIATLAAAGFLPSLAGAPAGQENRTACSSPSLP